MVVLERVPNVVAVMVFGLVVASSIRRSVIRAIHLVMVEMLGVVRVLRRVMRAIVGVVLPRRRMVREVAPVLGWLVVSIVLLLFLHQVSELVQGVRVWVGVGSVRVSIMMVLFLWVSNWHVMHRLVIWLR